MPDRPAPPLALTMGEPGGVGPELAFTAHAALRAGGPEFFVIGDAKIFAARGGKIAAIQSPAQTLQHFKDALPVLDIGIPAKANVGVADPASAPAVIASIEKAVEYALSGEASAVVTNPIQKASLIAAGFKHPGHTEFLEALTATAPMPKGRRRGGRAAPVDPDRHAFALPPRAPFRAPPPGRGPGPPPTPCPPRPGPAVRSAPPGRGAGTHSRRGGAA